MITKKQIEDILTKHQSKDHRSGMTVISVHDYGYVANDILAALNNIPSSADIIRPLPELDQVWESKEGRRFVLKTKNIEEVKNNIDDYKYICGRPHEDGRFDYCCWTNWCRCMQ